ncbi:hypothetical protein FALBO_7829 [Fusarium albosuccineum]|uniref:Uncharacterized protein n=1 Tax=Fusarium albosuccineum TaxID=1237068 RepID=A0A8H4LCS8_9HYPO|nr:hypothetical protein FALBO_7829 [Fusarium albosuccineum]
MAEAIDLAISAALFAYRTGRNNRQQRLVVRIRVDRGDLSSKKAKSTKAIIDANNGASAAPGLTDEELDISSASAKSLFVVVGELLPRNYFDDLQYADIRGSMTFDASKHTIVGPTEGTFIIVRPVKWARAAMYLLYRKGGGISSVAPLPAGYEDLIVYYPEWTTGVGHTHKAKRNDKYRENLSTFCHGFMAQRFPGLVQATSPVQEGQGTGTQVDESMDTQEDQGVQTEETQVGNSTILFPEIQDLFAKFDASGDKAWLFLAIKRLDAMCDNEFCNDLSAKGRLRMKTRTMLFCPEEFEMKDAEDLVRLAKASSLTTRPLSAPVTNTAAGRMVQNSARDPLSRSPNHLQTGERP